MRYLFYVITALLLVALSGSCGGRKPSEAAGYSSADTAVIEFAEYEHNFGKVVSGEKVAAIFSFRNTGNGPLIIQGVSTSCGCTLARYSTKPIKPGETGSVEVIFDSGGYNGIQRKTITVRSNATRPVVLLQITGEVIQNKNN